MPSAPTTGVAEIVMSRAVLENILHPATLPPG